MLVHFERSPLSQMAELIKAYSSILVKIDRCEDCTDLVFGHLTVHLDDAF
jgi:hypothetical protein